MTLDTIHNYSDHPARRHDPLQSIYLLDNNFYRGANDLVKITLQSIDSTNLGDPYRDLVLLEFLIQPANQCDSIEIELKDAARLVHYCQKSGYTLEVKPALMRHPEFIKSLNSI